MFLPILYPYLTVNANRIFTKIDTAFPTAYQSRYFSFAFTLLVDPQIISNEAV
jgi:hypothetical protein